MKLEELENRDKIVTNDFLRAEIEIVRKEMALLKADLMKAVVQSRHSQRTMILGIYVLIVIGIFASHVWR